jgi:NADH:ubiquinone oxidoreductase subunit 4 (subunit M)
VLSAIYLLWAYQRVALGEVTVEKNKTLPDASMRERIILVTMALAILFMGVASPLFTRRMEVSVNNILEQTSTPRNASRPVGLPRAPYVVALPAHPALAVLAERQVRP